MCQYQKMHALARSPSTMTSLSTQPEDLSLDQASRSISSNSSVFQKPAYTAFPAFYTLQPNLTTRTRQLELWSLYITHYCSWHKVFRLSITSPPSQLTTNPSPPRALKQADFRTILEHLSTSAGGNIIEWLPSAGSKGEQATACWVWWRSAAEWAERVYEWVDGTGQKGAVLTVYELRESDAVRGQGWTEMDEEMFRKVLGVLVKRGKAQVFGADEGSGVKFF
nr:vacuolar protein-sorting-associated protein 25 [Quercus suber]